MPWCLELKGFTVVFVSFCPQPKVPTWILTESVPHAVLLLLWKTAWSSAGPLASATFVWGCVWSQTKPRVWTLMPASLSSRYVCVLFVLTCLPVLLLGGQAVWPAWKIINSLGNCFMENFDGKEKGRMSNEMFQRLSRHHWYKLNIEQSSWKAVAQNTSDWYCRIRVDCRKIQTFDCSAKMTKKKVQHQNSLSCRFPS